MCGAGPGLVLIAQPSGTLSRGNRWCRQRGALAVYLPDRPPRCTPHGGRCAPRYTAAIKPTCAIQRDRGDESGATDEAMGGHTLPLPAWPILVSLYTLPSGGGGDFVRYMKRPDHTAHRVPYTPLPRLGELPWTQMAAFERTTVSLLAPSTHSAAGSAEEGRSDQGLSGCRPSLRSLSATSRQPLRSLSHPWAAIPMPTTHSGKRLHRVRHCRFYELTHDGGRGVAATGPRPL